MRAAFVGAVAAALITIPGLGSGTLWDNSETAYAEVAREILLTHDWLVMHFNLVPYFVQPPLYFWLGAIFASLWGATSFAFRFPSALATIVLGGIVGYAVARQAGTRVGIYASIILSSSLMQAVIGRLAIMDALLDLAVALTIFWWFRGLQTGRDRNFIYGAVAAAAGFLAKGLVAPVIALLVIVPFFLWNLRYESTHAPSARAWILGLLSFAAVALPWPAAVYSRYDGFFLHQLIGVYTVSRYTGVIENQSGPLWYYLPVIILGFFPWIAFLPMAVVYGITCLRSGIRDRANGSLFRLAFVWSVAPLLFFSFAGTKLPNYLALEFPALALLTALYFDSVVRRGGTRSAVVCASFVPVTIGLLAIAAAAFMRDNRFSGAVSDVIPGLIGLAEAIFAGSLLTAVMMARPAMVGAAPYALAFATLVAADVVTIVVLPRTDALKPIPHLAAIINRERQPYDTVAIQNTSGGNALLFYTRPSIDVLAPPAGGDPSTDGIDPRVAICGSQRAWLVAPARRPPFDPTYGRHRHLIAVDEKAALYLYVGPPCARGLRGETVSERMTVAGTINVSVHQRQNDGSPSIVTKGSQSRK
ncbi:MAG: glycosyltransferase family 39 protein [Candidatus Eremiobacteraeota bacterium]|nr:glycosyltransferase family 39 protein [Candidatus Eremiobacteraeota bacterium]